MNAICLVVDRLHAGYLGCYGNAWIATPEFDRLAARSFLFDQAIADTTTIEGAYRGLWRGAHACEGPTAELVSLPTRLAQAGIATTLLTDAPESVLGGPFDEQLSVERLDLGLPTRPAKEIEDTCLASLTAAAVEWLEGRQGPFCLWLHVHSLGVCWDAPLEFRNRYADADEPIPGKSVDVPHLVLPPDYDPDQLLAISQSYAGQVTLLDHCLGWLLDYLDASPLAKETLVAVLGLRGLALGEHRRVGAWDDALCGETIHVPWLLRFPDCLGATARTQALVQPPDLGATLADWWSLPGHPADAGRFARSLLPLVRDEVLTLRDRTCSISPAGERGLRTRAWYLRSLPKPLEGDPPGSERALYAKPDDRFEINDVAARCEDVVVALEAGANEFQRLASQSQLDQLPSLDDELVTEMRA